jgi:CheY-like chemotaxis protein
MIERRHTGATGDAGPAPEPPRRTAANWGKSPDLLKYTVFLVEDDSTDRNMILQTLQRSPHVHNVHWFESGERLMKHFIHEGYYSGTLIHTIPTLVLLDIALPGAGGMEILKRLKENPLTSDIPVIMVTGHISDDTARESYQLRANAFIAKPLHLDRVHEVMFKGWSWPTPPFRT